MAVVARQPRRNSDGDGPFREPFCYEDLIIERYLEELRKTDHSSKTKSVTLLEPSPYAQRLYQTPSLPAPLGFRRRPQSASLRKPRPLSATLERPSSQSSSSSKANDDDEEQVVGSSGRRYRPMSATQQRMDREDQWGSTTIYSDHRSRSSSLNVRPVSAQSRRRRPLSAVYGSSRPTSAKSGSYRRKSRTISYHPQDLTITVCVHKNGSKEQCTRVAAPNVRALLQISTERLGLTQAARKAFLEDGTELTDEIKVKRDTAVYVTTGEPFRSPTKETQSNMETLQNTQWTLNGIKTSENSNKTPSQRYKVKMSKRFQSLFEQPRKRILVFINGSGTNSVEIITDPNRMDELIEMCTLKLNLGSYARALYDWNGKEVRKLEDVPVLDQCLQSWSTPMLGPLWVSRGEGFSPRGVKEFLTGLIAHTKGRLKEAKHYKEQLELVQGEEEEKKKVKIITLLSMSEEEIKDAITAVDKDVEDYTNALNKLKAQLDSLQNKIQEEESEKNQYKMKHIKEIEKSNRLLGKNGIKLKVFENGSNENGSEVFFNLHQAMKSTTDKNHLMEKLFDECSNVTSLAYPAKSQPTSTLPRRMFDQRGLEVKSVDQLKYGQKVWLSYGEPWKNPLTYAISLRFDKVVAVEIQDSENNKSDIRPIKEPVSAEEINGLGGSLSKWELVQGLPDTVPTAHVIDEKASSERKDEIRTLLDSSEVIASEWFIQFKDKPSLVLYGEPVVEVKTKKAEGWPPESQIWTITKDGYICCKSLRHCVLALSNEKISRLVTHPQLGQSDPLTAEGFVVTMQCKSSAVNQQWEFTGEGCIVNKERPELVLTYLGNLWGASEEDDTDEMNANNRVQNQISNNNNSNMNDSAGSGGQRCYYIAVCQKLSNSSTPHESQRWAVKQERLGKDGEWKHTDVQNLEWKKQTLSWPVNCKGMLNEKYAWPMEGYLIPYAPLTKSATYSLPDAAKGKAPLRLKVMKNGAKDKNRAVPVVAPNLNMLQKILKKAQSKANKAQFKHDVAEERRNRKITEDAGSNRSERAIAASSNLGLSIGGRYLEFDELMHEMLHTEPEEALKIIEFRIFMDMCTQQLDLPFPARRLFDEKGKEHISLSNLSRDQYVSVTCGEPWSDPNLSRSEQQRRFLLANLSSDLAHIEQFIRMRYPSKDLVLQVDSNLTAGSRVVVNLKHLSTETSSNKEDMRKSTDSLQDNNSVRSSHELSHANSDERHKARNNWSWDVDGSINESVDVNDSVSSARSRRRSGSRSNKEIDRADLQKFIYEDGFIACLVNSNLVLSVAGGGGDSARGWASIGDDGSVYLARRQVDDIMQRWVIRENGFIQPKFDSCLVLSVIMDESSAKLQQPSDRNEEEHNTPYVGCSLGLQRKKMVEFGRANQRWRYDAETHHIYAFDTNTLDKEITAANRYDVCTFAVLGTTEVHQPGYVVELGDEGPKSGKKRTIVCSSCARAMRDQYKLTKLTESVDFSCAMGNAKAHKLKLIGSFKCLNGKVDLSSYEAVRTLEKWQAKYSKLRKELNVRRVVQGISSVAVPCTVRVRAYRNGEGRNPRRCEIILGSSIPGILNQATEVLGLYQPARRMYTSDGTLILDVEDLINWMKENIVGGGIKLESKLLTENAADNESDRVNSEDEQSDDSGNPKTTHKEYQIGCEVSGSRQYIDEESSCIIIPNPYDVIAVNGKLVSWQLFAKHDGMLALDVFRPVPTGEGDKNVRFTLVGQSVCELTEGELMIDISAKPLSVKRGDVIGFHIIHNAILPYDIIEGPPTPFYYLMTKQNPPINGEPLSVETSVEDGSRAYSLLAKIVSDEDYQEMTSSTSKEKKTKEKTTKKKEVTFGDTLVLEDDSVKQEGAHSIQSDNSKQNGLTSQRLDNIQRQPIDVFISCGEDFIDPEKAARNHEEELRRSQELIGVSYELSKEKHVLRQMRGRRFDEQQPSTFAPTQDPEHPINVQPGWTEPLEEEREKADLIVKLQSYLKDIKSKQKPTAIRPCKPDAINGLYTQPKTKRLLVFASGNKLDSAQFIYGENLAQVLDNSTMKLNLNAPARYLFDISGEQIKDFDSLTKDQIVCASTTRRFIPPEETQHLMQQKAKWARQIKEHGRKSTDIVVETRRNYRVTNDYLCSRGAPQLVLTLTDLKVKGHPGHQAMGQSDIFIEGYLVSLLPKERLTSQKWNFTSDGYIGSQENSELVLTYMKRSDDGPMKGGMQVGGGETDEGGYCLAACKRLQLDENPYQRSSMLLYQEQKQDEPK